jgi:hypothetical protein
MTRLAFTMLEARPSAQTAAPAITFRLRIEVLLGHRIHAMALRCHTRIDPRGRRYTREEQLRLFELFGDVSQWDRTLQALTWAQTSVTVPSFDKRIDVDVSVPCTYDLHVASAKYLHAVRDGNVPLVFLFSGTVFKVLEASYPQASGEAVPPAAAFQVEPVSWDSECSYRMPAQIWRTTMDQFFPGGGWLRLRRDTIDRLQAFRGQFAIVSWDDAIELLLHAAPDAEDPHQLAPKPSSPDDVPVEARKP